VLVPLWVSVLVKVQNLLSDPVSLKVQELQSDQMSVKALAL